MYQPFPPPNTDTDAAKPAILSEHACMSFTAPQFSTHDEEKERENLPPELKESLRQDLYGYSAILRETPEFLRDCREKMEEFLEHEIPAERKEEYTEALQQVPAIVADESDPLLFLRAEAYDPESAAWRMVNYWRMRMSIFGAQAFSPLCELEKDQQRQDREHGADDLRVEGGYPVGTYVPLPTDSFERSVTFFADGRQHDTHRALPFKSPARLLQPSIRWMYGRNLRIRRHVHYGDRRVLAKCLLEYGFKLEALPPSLGGTLEVGGTTSAPTQEVNVAVDAV
eukprot:scaffold1912_cov167-Amphora_coffeaeformis.AAC.9